MPVADVERNSSSARERYFTLDTLKVFYQFVLVCLVKVKKFSSRELVRNCLTSTHTYNIKPDVLSAKNHCQILIESLKGRLSHEIEKPLSTAAVFNNGSVQISVKGEDKASAPFLS